jgi:hypothetical protein
MSLTGRDQEVEMGRGGEIVRWIIYGLRMWTGSMYLRQNQRRAFVKTERNFEFRKF